MRTLKHGVRTHEFNGTHYDHFRTTGSGRKVHLFTKAYADQKDKDGKVVMTAAQQQETDIAKLLSSGAEEVKPS